MLQHAHHPTPDPEQDQPIDEPPEPVRVPTEPVQPVPPIKEP
ncbi:MAG: hypothetical protein V4805_04000 [Pseudomonadota bacterium]